jgi:DNA gyrase subunit A
MVQRTPVRGISSYGRASQGVKLMNIRDDDRVSAVALVAESSADTEARVQSELEENGSGPVEGAAEDVLAEDVVASPDENGTAADAE